MAKRQRIYFDANASAPLLEAARQAMSNALAHTGNPSSVHAQGRLARAEIETARGEVAALAGAAPDQVIFASGATEAAVMALTPQLLSGSDRITASHLYAGASEHPCVLSGGRFAAGDVSLLPVDANGVIDLAAMERALGDHDRVAGRPFVALMLANNETGVIHPVAQAAAIARRHDAVIFCDAVQAAGRIALDIKALGVDMLALSAHKMGGPQGVGALVLADEALRPAPLLTGGGQEKYRRAGTENVAAIAGFGVAAKAARRHFGEADRIGDLRGRLEAGIKRVTPDAVIFGAAVERLANTVLFAVPGVTAETAVIAFDLEGIAVSSGSACSSGKVGDSHVLAAMGVPPDLRRGAIRISLAPLASAAETEFVVDAWQRIYARLSDRHAA
ncbi:MAG: cysteine desulfurase [Hyphomicrobiales bacterium]|nr:cysteine desulfurase [Hyphomicrobiales bacterium]